MCVCVCVYSLQEVERQYAGEGASPLHSVVFLFTNSSSLTIKVNPEKLKGWNMEILRKEVNILHLEKFTIYMCCDY